MAASTSSGSSSSPLRLMRSYFSPFFIGQFNNWKSTAAVATTTSSSSSTSSRWLLPATRNSSSTSMFRRFSASSSTANFFTGSSSVFSTALPLMAGATRAASNTSHFMANPTESEREALRKLTEPVDWRAPAVVVAPPAATRADKTSREALTSSKQRATAAKKKQKKAAAAAAANNKQELPLGDKVFLDRFISANSTASSPNDLGMPITPAALTHRLGRTPSVAAVPRGKLQPQLAVPWEDCQHLYKPTDEFMVSLKLDGVRCLVRKSPAASGRIYAFSRRGGEFGFAHTPMRRIRDALQPLFDKYPKLVLDGELYVHGIEFGELNGAVRNESSAILMNPCGRTKLTKAVMDQAAASKRVVAIQEKMQFFAFDIAAWDRIDVRNTPYGDRMKLLHRLLKSTVATKHFAQPGAAIQVSPSTNNSNGADAKIAEPQQDAAANSSFPITASGRDGIKVLHQQFTDCANQNRDRPVAFLGSVRATKSELTSCRNTALGGDVEGIMIREPESGYTNSRNRALMKHKLMQDAEFKVVGAVAGKGQLAGALGALVFTTSKGEIFRAPYGGTIKEKVRLWKARDLLQGKLMTVAFQELTERGVPRFPVVKGFRGKSKSDCV